MARQCNVCLIGISLFYLLCWILPVVQSQKDPKLAIEGDTKRTFDDQRFFNASIHLSESIFENFYCGNIDGFPHFRLYADSDCGPRSSGKVGDRDFWTDGTGVSSFFVFSERYFESIQQLNSSSNLKSTKTLHRILQRLTSDWDLIKIREILLWDKLDYSDRYGVGNDDRLWYAIAFLQIHKYQESLKNLSQESLVENDIQKNLRSQKKSTPESQQKPITFLGLCKEIFQFIEKTQGDTQCDSGVFWNQDRSYKNSITNHLFGDLASKLFLLTGEKYYLEIAKTTAQWEIDKGLVDDKLDWLFYDGLIMNHENECSNIQTDKWTYNQGVFLEMFLVVSDNFSNMQQLTQVVEKNILSIVTPVTERSSDNSKEDSSINNSNNHKKTKQLQFYPYSNIPTYVVLQEFQNWHFTETTATFKGIYFRYLSAAVAMLEKLHNSLEIQQLSDKLMEDIRTYTLNNENYMKSLANEKNMFPFFWDEVVSYDDQVFSAGSSIAVLDLFGLSDYFRAKQIIQQQQARDS